jgi:hypothetical protein
MIPDHRLVLETAKSFVQANLSALCIEFAHKSSTGTWPKDSQLAALTERLRIVLG